MFSEKKQTLETYEPDPNQMTIDDFLNAAFSKEEESKLTSDLESSFNIEETIKKVAELAVASAPKIMNKRTNKKSGDKKRSPKALTFVAKDSYTPFKAAIIERINERNYTYGDLIEFCIERADGNEEVGRKKAYNHISSLKSGDDLMSSTVSELLEFLNLSAMLVDKDKVISEFCRKKEENND